MKLHLFKIRITFSSSQSCTRFYYIHLLLSGKLPNSEKKQSLSYMSVFKFPHNFSIEGLFIGSYSDQRLKVTMFQHESQRPYFLMPS